MANKEAKAKKENSKNKKSFFKDFKAELKKVNWPTPKQLLNNTIAVITIVIITAVIVFVLDLVFETLNKHGIDKIKEVITTENTVENNEAGENTNVEGETKEEDATNETEGEASEGEATNEVEENTESNETEPSTTSEEANTTNTVE